MIKVDLMTRRHCSHCKRDFVVYQPYSGLYLCQCHLGRDIHAKARRIIRKQTFVQKGDHIGIFFRPDAMSVTLLDVITGVCRERRDLQVSVIIPGVSHHDALFQSHATRVAHTHNYAIILSDPSYYAGDSMSNDEGWLEDLADSHGCTKVAVPDTLDDVAPCIFDVVFGLETTMKRLCLSPGQGARMITPLMGVRTEEAQIYGNYLVGKDFFSPSPMDFLASPDLPGFQERHPSTYYALLRIWEEGHDCMTKRKAREQDLIPDPRYKYQSATDAGNGGVPPA